MSLYFFVFIIDQYSDYYYSFPPFLSFLFGIASFSPWFFNRKQFHIHSLSSSICSTASLLRRRKGILYLLLFIFASSLYHQQQSILYTLCLQSASSFGDLRGTSATYPLFLVSFSNKSAEQTALTSRTRRIAFNSLLHTMICEEFAESRLIC